MSIIKRTDVIPILYFGGTGGHFLASLLHHAKNNRKSNDWNFSKYGNAHKTKKDFIRPGPSMWVPSMEHINALQQRPISILTEYAPSHCTDPVLALTYFDKIIKTHFTAVDLEEISIAFAVKWGLEEEAFESAKLKEVLATRKLAYREFTSLVNELSDSENKVLNLSWQEILHADPGILIGKLSLFTAIPYENFSMYHFLKWRELTNKAITEFRDILV